MKRTTDHVENATNEFFESHDLNGAAVAYFAVPFIQDKIDEGHNRYKCVLDAAQDDIPEGADVLMGEVLEKHTLTREEYEQEVFKTFKEKFRDTFVLAAIYVPMSQLMKNLLNNPEDENQLELLMSAMDDILESMTHRIEIIMKLCLEIGMPLEKAEEIADEIADKIDDSNFIIGKIEIVPDGDDEDPEECDDKCSCSGECGGRCDCEGREACEENDHCQCGDACKCGNHA